MPINTPKAIEQRKGVGPGVPQFGLGDAVYFLGRPIVYIIFETDSQYSPDSVFSNFKRKYGSSFQETRSNDPKRRKGRLDARTEGGSYICDVQIWPYREGSKTTFMVKFKADGFKDKRNNMDLTESLKLIKDSLVRLVNR